MAVHEIIHGHVFEDFELGQVWKHHWGRTVTAMDNNLYTCLTMNFNPSYFNSEYAKSLGYNDMVINPLLVSTMIMCLSVEDLSERGGPFLGIEYIDFHGPVYPNDTLYAESTVVEKRESNSRPGWGIVKWRTMGRNQRDEVVVELVRANLVNKRGVR